MERVAPWLAAHQPPAGDLALIHNDFKYDNVVLDPARLDRVVAVLDWEMATVGDPLMDLGTTLAYWVDPDDPPAFRAAGFVDVTTQPGSLRRREVAERYARATGRDLSRLPFYYAFGLFKVAVIAQQIYARFVQGHTRDPRFAHLDAAVAACASTAAGWPRPGASTSWETEKGARSGAAGDRRPRLACLGHGALRQVGDHQPGDADEEGLHDVDDGDDLQAVHLSSVAAAAPAQRQCDDGTGGEQDLGGGGAGQAGGRNERERDRHPASYEQHPFGREHRFSPHRV